MSGFSFLRWAFNRARIVAGCWFGTSRMLTFSSPKGGTTVFTPGPMCPPTNPCTSKVGAAQIRWINSARFRVRIDRNPYAFLNRST